MKERICECGGTIKPSTCLADGFQVDCLECQKCGEVLYTPEQAKKVEAYGIREGIVDDVRVLSPKSLEIRFQKRIV